MENQYHIYMFGGLDNSEKKVSLKQFITKLMDKMYEEPYNVGTDEIYYNTRILPEADFYSIEEVRQIVESGCVIIPFSKKIKLKSLISYINCGLKPVFMKPGDYKSLLKDYSDYGYVIEDGSQKPLF